MRSLRAPVTLALAGGIAAASLLLFWLARLDWAAFAGGFISIRVAGTPPYMLTDGTLPVWLTPLSATLIHGSVLHLGSNLLMLVFAGNAIERPIGPRGIMILYVVGAYAAAAAHWLVDPGSHSPLIGASGAVSALIGAYSLLFAKSRTKAIGPFSAGFLHAIWLIVAWAAINIILQLVTSGSGMPIAGVAHIGGFIAGILLARPLLAAHWRTA
ncbi:rhomboid family intramembrane serine protease [Sphingomonas japonica]|uniref:Membrane associated rhomboid family serine protease n=1 Tax=Sphingomonas japonica TaxID=511662 RepID=A0ABX0U2S6_9SPHN|nr:rhomboid family intramembrane serine protease [Sphingomonas japonica]NIJ24886.1 membrane associated rhomboid family serine protease [Sphingomonas japonica]